jgi:hypothetical protein
MSDLNDLVPALKRSMAVPGGFDAVFPSVTDEDLVGLALDSIAEAQLDGFLLDYAVDGLAETVTPDLSAGEAVNAAGALVLIYAAYRVVLNELRNLRNREMYQAGSAKAETERTASMLNEILRQLNERKKGILERALLGELATDVYVGDLSFIKATSDWQLAGLFGGHGRL